MDLREQRTPQRVRSSATRGRDAVATGDITQMPAGSELLKLKKMEYPLARILGYIAASLDGFIATKEESLDWLFKYNSMDLGEHDYKTFLKRIRTIVMG